MTVVKPSKLWLSLPVNTGLWVSKVLPVSAHLRAVHLKVDVFSKNQAIVDVASYRRGAVYQNGCVRIPGNWQSNWTNVVRFTQQRLFNNFLEYSLVKLQQKATYVCA